MLASHGKKGKGTLLSLPFPAPCVGLIFPCQNEATGKQETSKKLAMPWLWGCFSSQTT